MGSWLMTEMRDSVPEDFELAVAPFPEYEGGAGSQDAMFGRALSWSVPAGTDVPDLAVEFLRRFTSKETATKRAEELGAVTPILDAPAPPGIDGIEQVLEDAQSAEFILYNYGVGSAQFGLREAWYNPLVEMWLGQLSPQEALDKIDANMAAVREQRREAAQ